MARIPCSNDATSLWYQVVVGVWTCVGADVYSYSGSQAEDSAAARLMARARDF